MFILNLEQNILDHPRPCKVIKGIKLTWWFCITRQSVLNFLSKSGGNLQNENGLHGNLWIARIDDNLKYSILSGLYIEVMWQHEPWMTWSFQDLNVITKIVPILLQVQFKPSQYLNRNLMFTTPKREKYHLHHITIFSSQNYKFKMHGLDYHSRWYAFW